jgi:diguanylate cyclase (GGDEF)-like protein/PAS domain S-box-containing protein
MRRLRHEGRLWLVLKRASAVRPDSAAVTLSSLTLDRMLIDSLTEHAIFGLSPSGIIMSWNQGAQRTFGYAPDEAIGMPFTLIFTDQDAQSGAPQRELSQSLSGQCTQHDRWHVRKDATQFWGTNTVQPAYAADGKLFGFTKLICDTTTSHLAYQQLYDSEQRHRLLVDSVQHFAIFAVSPEGTIESWPAAAELVFGYRPCEIIGQNFSTLFAAVNGGADPYNAYLEEATICGSSNVDASFIRKDGSHFRGSGRLSELHTDVSNDFRGYVQIIHDITESEAAQQELQRRAHFDELTALPNRRTFFEFVARSIALARRNSSFRFAVLFADLDYFKLINDTHGHTVADNVLKETARRLEVSIRKGDIAARIGGDEFAVLLNGIGSVQEADDAAERIAVAMRKTMLIDDREVDASISLGIAIGSAVHETPEDIIRDADTAMYAAKRAGRSRAVRLNTQVFQQPQVTMDDLRSAIANGEMRAVFQPVMRLKDMMLVGFEALIRWEHPTRGLMQPYEFIPAAERSEDIYAIDRFMIEEALRQLCSWQRDSLYDRIQMSVNISGREFSHHAFLDDLSALVAASGVSPHCLRLEITEGASMEQSDAVRAMMATIRSIGISIDIDDFGTGYSSLQALQRIDVDALKIDASFVASIGSVDTVLLDAVIGLAHDLGTIAIAEGIETDEQLAYLISVGCELGQGFLFSGPLDGPDALLHAVSLVKLPRRVHPFQE